MVSPIILLIFLLTVDLGDASCFQVDFPASVKGCLTDDKLHLQGEKWSTKDCQDCTCFKQHMICCLRYMIPYMFDRENCVDIFDLKTCVFHVVKKSNPGKKCEILSASG